MTDTLQYLTGDERADYRQTPSHDHRIALVKLNDARAEIANLRNTEHAAYEREMALKNRVCIDPIEHEAVIAERDALRAMLIRARDEMQSLSNHDEESLATLADLTRATEGGE